MRDKDIKKLHQPDGITYVNGLGFVEPDNTPSSISDIRRYAGSISLAIFMYFLGKHLFFLPAVKFAGLLGFEIYINEYTGMIMKTPLSNAVVSMFIEVASIFVAIAIVYSLCARGIKSCHLLCRPSYGITSIAIPMVLAVNILGLFLSDIFNIGSTTIGILFPKIPDLITNNDFHLSITLLATTLIVCVAEEFLFRGVLLFALRRFGDGFAIIISTAVYTLFTDSLLKMIWAFFIGLALAYFTIRGGSTLIAIICRISIVLFTFITAIPSIYLDSELAFVITGLLCLTAVAFGGIAYIYFMKQDSNAFLIKKASGSLSLRRKISGFICSVSFMLLIVFIGLRVIFNMQIIS